MKSVLLSSMLLSLAMAPSMASAASCTSNANASTQCDTFDTTTLKDGLASLQANHTNILLRDWQTALPTVTQYIADHFSASYTGSFIYSFGKNSDFTIASLPSEISSFFAANYHLNEYTISLVAGKIDSVFGRLVYANAGADWIEGGDKLNAYQQQYFVNAESVAVPGPEAGVGLAGLALAGMGAYVVRRRKAAIAA